MEAGRCPAPRATPETRTATPRRAQRARAGPAAPAPPPPSARGRAPRRRGAPTLPQLEADREDREDDHDRDDQVNVPADVRNRLTQEVAGPGQPDHPQDPADHVVAQEP